MTKLVFLLYNSSGVIYVCVRSYLDVFNMFIGSRCTIAQALIGLVADRVRCVSFLLIANHKGSFFS